MASQKTCVFLCLSQACLGKKDRYIYIYICVFSPVRIALSHELRRRNLLKVQRVPQLAQCSRVPARGGGVDIEAAAPLVSRDFTVACKETPLSFRVLSLCSSRACLGKMFVFIQKWLEQTVVARHRCQSSGVGAPPASSRAAGPAVPRSAARPSDRPPTSSPAPLQENASLSLFECFPHVCPEPVLAKRPVLYIKCFLSSLPVLAKRPKAAFGVRRFACIHLRTCRDTKTQKQARKRIISCAPFY